MSGTSRLNLFPQWNLLHEAVSKVCLGFVHMKTQHFKEVAVIGFFLLWKVLHEAVFGVCLGFVHMREQHFDNVATNSFLPIGVEHDLSARFCRLYLKLIGLWLHSFSRC